MKIRELASLLSRGEGGKHEASVGDIREILGLLSDLMFEEILEYEHSEIFAVLVANGKRRFHRRKVRRK